MAKLINTRREKRSGEVYTIEVFMAPTGRKYTTVRRGTGKPVKLTSMKADRWSTFDWDSVRPAKKSGRKSKRSGRKSGRRSGRKSGRRPSRKTSRKSKRSVRK